MSASTDLTSLAKLKTYLGIGASEHDELLEALIDAASDAIEHYCGREFAYGSRIEIRDGVGARTVVLKCRPVESVTSVHIDSAMEFDDGALLPESEYTFYPEEGLLTRMAGVFSPGVRNVKIVYVAGYEAIPPAVEQAANILAAHFFHRGHQGGDGIESENIGSYTVSYDTSDWPHQARALLAEFREMLV